MELSWLIETHKIIVYVIIIDQNVCHVVVDRLSTVKRNAVLMIKRMDENVPKEFNVNYFISYTHILSVTILFHQFMYL